jgi:hypothetical protein
MPILLSNGTSVLSGPSAADEAIVAAYCNANSIFTDAALKTAIDTITSVANNTGVNTTFLGFERAHLKSQFFISP